MPRTSENLTALEAVFATHPIFRGVGAQTLDRLKAEGSLKTWSEGEMLLAEGSEDLAFFVLYAGSVRVFYTSPDGVQIAVKLFRAPACFGEMECLSKIAYLESVEALETCRALVLPRDSFKRVLRRSHALTYNLLRDVSARLCIAAQNERSLAFHPIEVRLANLFVAYLDLHGLPTDGGTMIRVPLSQDALANSLGVARRSVTRTLQAWADEQLVIKRGGKYIVTDRQKLVQRGDPTFLRIGYQLGKPLK